MRDRTKDYEKRGLEVWAVFAHQPSYVRHVVRARGFQLGELPFTILADEAATVSATYGVAFQMHEAEWSNRETAYVIDRAGVVRAVIDEGSGQCAQVLDDLAEQRRLIEGLKGKDAALRGAAALVLGPVEPTTRPVVPVLAQALKHSDGDIRAGSAAALCWIAADADAAVPALVVACSCTGSG